MFDLEVLKLSLVLVKLLNGRNKLRFSPICFKYKIKNYFCFSFVSTYLTSFKTFLEPAKIMKKTSLFPRFFKVFKNLLIFLMSYFQTDGDFHLSCKVSSFKSPKHLSCQIKITDAFGINNIPSLPVCQNLQKDIALLDLDKKPNGRMKHKFWKSKVIREIVPFESLTVWASVTRESTKSRQDLIRFRPSSYSSEQSRGSRLSMLAWIKSTEIKRQNF